MKIHSGFLPRCDQPNNRLQMLLLDSLVTLSILLSLWCPALGAPTTEQKDYIVFPSQDSDQVEIDAALKKFLGRSRVYPFRSQLRLLIEFWIISGITNEEATRVADGSFPGRVCAIIEKFMGSADCDEMIRYARCSKMTLIYSRHRKIPIRQPNRRK